MTDLVNFLKSAARMANDEGELELATRLRRDAAKLEFAEIKRKAEPIVQCGTEKVQ